MTTLCAGPIPRRRSTTRPSSTSCCAERGRIRVRIHPCAALTKGLAGSEMAEIGLLKEAGAVAFGDAHRSVMNAQVMRRAMVYARDRGPSSPM